MADIFLSYQKRDIDLARRVDAALQRAGFTVWWDDNLSSLEQWDRTIEREIAAAGAVLVLWTPNSVQSDWVRVEANYAKNCTPSKLVQARFAGAEVPMAFSLNQYVDLPWDRPAQGGGWKRLLEWLRAAVTGDGASVLLTPPPAGSNSSEGSGSQARSMRSFGSDPMAWIALAIPIAYQFASLLGLDHAGRGQIIDLALLILSFTQLSFSVPVGLYLMRRGAIGAYFVAALCAVIAAAHGAAFGAAVNLNSRDLGLSPVVDHFVIGFAGGFIGAALSFIGLLFLDKGLREPDAKGLMLLSTLALALVGGFTTAIAPWEMFGPPTGWIYIPWQIAFAFILFRLLGGRYARGRW